MANTHTLARSKAASLNPLAALRRRGLSIGDVLGAMFVASLAIAIAFGPWLTPYSAFDFDSSAILTPPSFPHIFGTDEFGRDLFSRVLYGARSTLLLAVAAAAIGTALGTITGLVTGYFGGAIDEAIMRLMDALMSMPAIVLAMLIVVMLGPSNVNLVAAISVAFWPRCARIVRSVAIDIAKRDFVAAARARREMTLYILFGEILPNLWSIIVVEFSLRVTYGILMTASLSYLGIGVSPPTPAWGLMVREGQQFIQIAPWLVIFPCAAVSIVSIGTVMIGERLRVALNVPGRTSDHAR